MRASLGIALVVAAGLSCAGAGVTPLGARRPARPAGCAVEIVPGAPPGPAPVVDLAATRVRCLESAREDCLAELRRQTCGAGGDTAYGLSESVDQHIIYLTATIAARGQAGAGAPPSPAAPSGPGACVPICSPGFDCQAGRCIPLCNPACDPSEICNRHRTCEPAPAAPAPG